MSHRLVYIVVRIIAFVSGHIGNRGRTTLASFIAHVMMLADRSRRDITRSNIRESLLGIPRKEVETITTASYKNLSQCYVELFATPYISRENIDQRFVLENEAFLRTQARSGRGLVLVSAHFGNWEWAVQTAASKLGRNILCIAKAQRNLLVDGFINACRTTTWTSIVEMQSAAKRIISTLKNGGVVAMLADQAADPKRDVFVDFFGRPAVTFEAPAALALRYNADIVAAFAIRQSDGNYRVQFIPVPHEDIGESKEGIRALVQRISLVVESVIRQYPGQWSWQHKKWKYNPLDYNTGNGNAH